MEALVLVMMKIANSIGAVIAAIQAVPVWLLR